MIMDNCVEQFFFQRTPKERNEFINGLQSLIYPFPSKCARSCFVTVVVSVFSMFLLALQVKAQRTASRNCYGFLDIYITTDGYLRHLIRFRYGSLGTEFCPFARRDKKSQDRTSENEQLVEELILPFIFKLDS